MHRAKPILATAWQQYYATLEELRLDIESTPRFQRNPNYRSEAYHCMLEAQAMVYNSVIATRQFQPRIYSYGSLNTRVYSLGQNSGNCRYGLTMLDGRSRYTLRGRIGDIKPFLVQAISPMLGTPNSVTTGNYELNHFAQDDGTFDVTLSAERSEGSWIELDRDSQFNFIFIRRWFSDVDDDMGEINIELIDPQSTLLEESEEVLASRIDAASSYMAFLIRQFVIGLYDAYLKVAGGNRNTFGYMAGETISNDLLGSPSTSYGVAVADCELDEALIVEGTPPLADHWSFQLGSVWSKPLDFVNCRAELNMKEVHIDADGKYRLVICHVDPGIRNWLSTVGQTEFVVVYRNYNEVGVPRTAVPSLKRIKLSELEMSLPQGSATQSIVARAESVARKQAAYQRLYE